MDKTRSGKIFTIIICFALTAAVIIYSIFAPKDDNKSQYKEIRLPVDITGAADEEALSDSDKEAVSAMDAVSPLDQQTSSLDDSISDNADTAFELLHLETLYAMDLPNGVFTNLTEEIRGYVTGRYGTAASDITKVVILEESIKTDQENNLLSFGIRLDKGAGADYAYITIDLASFNYTIRDVDV